MPATQPQTQDAEIATLQAENAKLHEQLAAAKGQLAERTAATATAPKPRLFTTMQDILVNTPADLRPLAKPEWYKYTESKFENWWEAQLVGMNFEETLPLGSKSVSRPIVPIPGVEWIATLGFGGKSFTYFGGDHRWSISIPKIDVDEAGAKKWDAVKIGSLFKIKAVISKIDIGQTEYNHSKLPTYHIRFTLRDVELTPPS